MSSGNEIYRAGDFELQNGGVLKDAFLAYRTLGDPSLPAIIYLTWYSGKIEDNLWLTGADKTLNPAKYYIIIPALIGNGESISPSNTPDLRPWPSVNFYDNVKMQHKLVTEHLGVKHAHAVLGWSMGAGQTFQWATMYPDFMDYAVPFCGAAETGLFNQVMLEGVKVALLSGKGVVSAGVGKNELATLAKHGPWTQQEREISLKALGRVYAGWGFSQAFYREKVYQTAPTLGFKDLEDFMVNFWEAWGLSKDPEDMLAMLYTWQSSGVSKQEPFNGSFSAAMKAIKAKTLVMPSDTDFYFPPEESLIEVQHMRPGVGKLLVFPSIWGHWAGGPGQSTEDVKFLDTNLAKFFAS